MADTDQALQLAIKIIEQHRETNVFRNEILGCLEFVKLLQVFLEAYQIDDCAKSNEIWINKLIEGLKLLHETINLCYENSFWAYLTPTTYTDKLKKAIINIESAMKMISLSNEKMSIETRNKISETKIRLKKSKQQMESFIFNLMHCPISGKIMINPIVLGQSGQTYDRETLLLELEKKPNIDPFTKNKFDGNPNLIDNFAIKSVINEWKKFAVIEEWKQQAQSIEQESPHKINMASSVNARAEEPNNDPGIQINEEEEEDDEIDFTDEMDYEDAISLSDIKLIDPITPIEIRQVGGEFSKEVEVFANNKSNKSKLKSHFKISSREARAAKKLSKNGHIDTISKEFGHTPLTWEIFRNHHLKMAAALIKYGANVDTRKHNGQTPLIYAAGTGRLEYIDLLVKAGANLNDKEENEEGQTALICAANEGYDDIVQLLIDAGADINLQDNEGRTALICAACEGHSTIVKLLIDVGANLNLTIYSSGQSALDCALVRGKTDCVRLLEERFE